MEKIDLKNECKIKNLEIHHFYDLEEYLRGLFPKFFLFTRENLLSGTIFTDGEVEEGPIWIDKRPSFFDSDLEKYQRVNRHEFFITGASYVLVEKELLDEEKVIRDFYYTETTRKKILSELEGVEISIKENEKVKIRKR